MSKHSPQYKITAIEYALQSSSVNQAAIELNIPSSTLQDWVMKHKLLNQNNPASNNVDVQNELIKKNKEIKKLQKELEILKKFKAYSAKIHK